MTWEARRYPERSTAVGFPTVDLSDSRSYAVGKIPETLCVPYPYDSILASQPASATNSTSV